MTGRESRSDMAASEHYKRSTNCIVGRDMDGRNITPSVVAAEPHPVSRASPDITPHAFKKLSPREMD